MGAQIPSMFLNFMGSDIDWGYNTEPETSACLSSEGQRCYWPRGKVLGGTSVINGMMYIRGNREDYDDWAALGNPGWSYDEVLPFFKKSENNLEVDEVGADLHGTGGPMPVGKFPYNPPLSYAILKAGEELGKFENALALILVFIFGFCIVFRFLRPRFEWLQFHRFHDCPNDITQRHTLQFGTFLYSSGSYAHKLPHSIEYHSHQSFDPSWHQNCIGR